MERPSKDEQDTIVGELAGGVETLSEEEFDALYDQLVVDYQTRADDKRPSVRGHRGR